MKLIQGKGGVEKGACWMSAINWYLHADDKGFTWHDHPSCVDSIIRHLAFSLNDRLLSTEREKIIGPHLFTPIGTNAGRKMTVKRIRHLIDFVSKHGHDAISSTLESIIEVAKASVDKNGGLFSFHIDEIYVIEYEITRLLYCINDADLLKVILELCAMGDKAEVDPCRTKQQVCDSEYLVAAEA